MSHPSRFFNRNVTLLTLLAALLLAFVAAPAPLLAQVPTRTPLVGDLNHDDIVNASDQLLLMQNWLRQAPSFTPTAILTEPTVTFTPTLSNTPFPTATQPSDLITINLPALVDGARELRMLRIPSGSFLMGSPESERSRFSDEGPVHSVNIGYEFYMGETEVTQAQYRAVMGTNPARDWGVGNDHPVYYVSWNDAKAFVAELNKLGQGTFRLPSEAEWEYACRAGTQTRFFFGDSLGCDDYSEDCAAGELPGNRSDYMWWSGSSSDGTKPVAQLLPNQWGLYDMHGNMWEWCEDCWYGSYDVQLNDGSAYLSQDCDYRVFRGGYWGSDARYLRSASRYRDLPNFTFSDVGFRVARTP